MNFRDGRTYIAILWMIGVVLISWVYFQHKEIKRLEQKREKYRYQRDSLQTLYTKQTELMILHYRDCAMVSKKKEKQYFKYLD